MRYLTHPDDCKRIQEICLRFNWDISLSEADVMWGWHSMGQSCGWATLPTTQQDIWDIIEPMLDRLMTGEDYQPYIGQDIYPEISIQQTTKHETMPQEEQPTPQAEQPQEPDTRFKLTMDILNDPSNRSQIIAEGTIPNSPEGIFMTNSNQGMMLRWILKMGGGYGDWAVYVHWATHSTDYVKDYGDKVTMKSNLLKIIDFDDDCWRKYRP